jgi:ribosome recycling factor
MAIDDVMLEMESGMESGIDYLRQEFRGIRTGRASAGLVDHIKVEYYGSMTDMRQLASISTPDASLIIIKPFDATALKEIERAIQKSELGINPQSDGKIIRLVVPSLSTERRAQIAGQLKKMSEATRVTIRNARRDANKEIDALKKASEITEDDAKTAKEDVQTMTDDYEKKVEEILAAKTTEIQET